MAKKQTINVITALTDPIFGTTYKTEPMQVIPNEVAAAQKQFTKYKTQNTQKVRSERTKKK